jgi:hypothetical protein
VHTKKAAGGGGVPAPQGFLIGHVTPEAQEGGPLALVHSGDIISIDAVKRTLILEVPDNVRMCICVRVCVSDRERVSVYVCVISTQMQTPVYWHDYGFV